MELKRAGPTCYRTNFPYASSGIVLSVMRLTYTRGLIRFSNCAGHSRLENSHAEFINLRLCDMQKNTPTLALKVLQSHYIMQYCRCSAKTDYATDRFSFMGQGHICACDGMNKPIHGSTVHTQIDDS